MIAEISQWASGVSLGWALFSLSVGALLLALIVGRLWMEYRRGDGDDG